MKLGSSAAATPSLSFENYKSVKVLHPEPGGDGGQVLNDNFRALADANESLAASIDGKADAKSLTAHTSNTNNPHATTQRLPTRRT